MEFSIEILKDPNGYLLIDDYSKQFGHYLDEDAEDTIGNYKYSECQTVSIITRINLEEVQECVDIIVHKHDVNDTVLRSQCKLPKDGYYKVYQLIIPTLSWFNVSRLDNYNVIYVIDDYKFKKYKDGSFVECSDIFELINSDFSTICKYSQNIFYTGFLYKEYVSHSYHLLKSLTKSCPDKDGEYNDFRYVRDFLWMVINIVNYHVDLKNYMEALRILNLASNCEYNNCYEKCRPCNCC